jgi:subtilisin family serine protease
MKTTATIAAIVLLAAVCAAQPLNRIDDVLAKKLEQMSDSDISQVIIVLTDQVDVSGMHQMFKQVRASKHDRHYYVVTALQQKAAETQGPLMGFLASKKTAGEVESFESMWIVNMIFARASKRSIIDLSKRGDIDKIYEDGVLMLDAPVDQGPASYSTESSEPNLRAINAHRLWALGYTGQGSIIMNIDTGVNGAHPALAARWRGNQPGVQWYHAWFDQKTPPSTVPVDYGSSKHGSHTMGIMTGLDPATADTIGVAPGALWIASPTIDVGFSPATSYTLRAFQWAADPDSNVNTSDDVPDAISNSYQDPDVSSTQCSGASGYWAAVDAVEAIGSAVVWSAGNAGSAAQTITPPKNRITTSVNFFATGNLNTSTSPPWVISSSSSRGPSVCDNVTIKPEVVAPGTSIRSSLGGTSYGTMSGTSMASPHVAGAIALLRSIAPFMTGTEIKEILYNTAIDYGTPGEDNTYGKGLIDLWAAYQTLPLNMGYVRGQVASAGSPLSGVQVGFIENVQQVGSTTGSNGLYTAAARIDTPNTSARYTLRAQKFGYLTYTDTITLVLSDTMTRNIAMSAAPGGVLALRVRRNDSTGVRANVRVIFGSTTVVNEYTDSTTGNLSAPLPAGSYDVIVDPPSPYGTQRFTGVTIGAGQTTTVTAVVRYVVEPNPTAMRDTLGVGQSHAKILTLTNTTSDTVPYRVYDDNALMRVKKIAVQPDLVPIPAIEGLKGVPDKENNPPVTDGHGGPDPFGYSWIDSDEPGGPQFNWFNIDSIGTLITTWSGSGDDGSYTTSLPWSFPLYGNSYTAINVCTNGFVNFGAASTAYSNTTIPNVAEPNRAIYAFWDDLAVSTRGRITYYNDVANLRFIVQYTGIPHLSSTTDTLTFQVILKPNGEILMQYLRMVGTTTLTSGTIGIENANGTVATQVVANAAYVHNNLAIRYYLPDASWLSENPIAGVLAPSSSQNILVTFDATGLLGGTTYNANIFIDATHPDVSGPILVPVSLCVTGPAGVRLDRTSLPKAFELHQNFPNPFNPATVISYALPKEAAVTLKVFNIVGQEVAALVVEMQPAGYYEVTWDGRNANRSPLSSGIYFVRIDALPTNSPTSFIEVRKMILLK